MFGWLLGLEDRSSLENPRLSLTDPEAWEALFGDDFRSASGIRVSKKKALMAAPVWCAVSLISGTGAKLPIDCFKRRPDLGEEGRERDEFHPAHWLVRWQANPELAAFFFWRQMWMHRLLWNNAYAYIDQDDPGRPRGLYPLLPDRTAPERLNRKQLVQHGVRPDLAAELDGQLVYVTETNGRCIALDPTQILHFRGISIDGFRGCDLVEHAKNAIGLWLSREKFGSLFFRNGARMGGILELPSSMKKETKDKVEDGFRKTYEREDAWFKTFVARDNVKFHQAAFNPRDSQLNEVSEGQTKEIARFYKLPPSKLGLSDSVSYNSKAEDNQAFLDDTLGDDLVMFGAECHQKLLSQHQRDRGTHFFEHNTKALLKQDTQKRFNAYRVACGRPWMTVNEVRAAENQPPVPGGNELAPASPGAAAPKAEPGKEPEPGKETGDPPAGDDQRLAQRVAATRVMFTLGQRARHKAKSPAGYRQWVGQRMQDLRDELTATGVDGGLLDPIVAELRTAGDADDVAAAVEALMSRHEARFVRNEP